MEIRKTPLGLYQTNFYAVWAEGSATCAIIDPGAQPERAKMFLDIWGTTPEVILLTHGHFDHVGAVQDLAEEFSCPVYLCEEDLRLPENLTAGPLYYTHSYGEGDKVHAAGLEFSVMHTPGHTGGSVCLVCQDAIFSGDTLFEGTCGRSDLGGDHLELMGSLRRLADLEGDYRVYPGHGDPTTLENERKNNPYIR